MELYFIRHGQSVNNAFAQKPGYIESSDPELTENGIQQSHYVASYLSKNQQLKPSPDGWNSQNRYGFGLTHLYSSLMTRAVHTGTPTALALQIPFAAWEDIHEEGGIYPRTTADKDQILPGKPRSFFEKNFPQFQLPPQLGEQGWWNRPFEAEEDRPIRAKKFLADLLTRHGDKPGQPEDHVAIFSHGGFFVLLLSAMLELQGRQAAHDMRSWFLLNNASISRIDLRKGELTFCYINRTDHLPDHLIT